ncbi:hypothetical protein [Thermus sediminis]|uniref:hypothetical protein n=1 Tax=Thermus sediminis TaxID=1761908 RepID=UPI001E32BB03|nr:hypothetical protein [Thermus sediminis]
MELGGELRRHFRAWGYTGPIGPQDPLGRALGRLRELGPFWLRVEGEEAHLALLREAFPTDPLLSPERALGQGVEWVRRELEALAELVRALGMEEELWE